MVKPIPPELLEHVVKGGFLDCKHIHDHTCLWEATIRFGQVFKYSYKYYLPIHVIPLLIFKWKKLKTEPFKTLKIFTYNYVKSVCFMSLYVAILKYTLCKSKNIRGKVDEINPILGAFFSAFAVVLEPESRASEIALFILPRFIQTLWYFLRKRNVVKDLPGGQVLVFAFAMGIINYFYQRDEKAIKASYLSVFKKFWGVN